MASVDLENLTDSQIRQKFIELGQNIGPLTSTTRKVYLKKLKSLLDGNSSSADLNSSKYDPKSISHSSGEESDVSPKSRRRNMPPPRASKSPTRRKSPSRANGNNALANSTFLDRNSDPEPTYNSRSSPAFTSVETKRSTLSSFSQNSSFISQEDDEWDKDMSLPRSLLSPSNKDTYLATDTNTDFGAGLSDTFRSRLQASSGVSPYSTSSYNSPRLSSSSNQPYVSDFVKRLSANKSAAGNSSKLLDVKESDDEDSGTSHVYTRFTQGGKPSNIKSRIKEATPYQDSWLPFDSPISAVLLLVFSLFFVFIGITYVNMHSADTNVSSPSEIYYPLCSTLENGVPRVNCIKDNDKEMVTKLFKIIYNELHEKLKSSACQQIGDGPFGMSDVDIQAAVSNRDPSMAHWFTQQQLPNVKVLISTNPQFKLIDITGGIAILDPPLPLYCYMINNLSWLALVLLKIGIVAVLFGGIYFGAKYWMKREASQKDEVYKLANSIIEIVSGRSENPDSIVPITHVRDQLIAPQDRKRLEKLWNNAVNVLNADSRIRCEQHQVEGEDCLVWRWVATSYNSNKRKTWQGQAFDTMEGSVNSLPNSPTSCLKIRHMFDAALEEGDDWVPTVVDAILEKTRDAQILHIAVERQSREGCVYMKCASPLDAGKAYRSLHGSWFDSKLVTVKYIREARYLERFPESAKCTSPLHPSSSSARQPFK